MTIATTGKNRIRDLTEADITSGQLGTNDQTPSAADTGLITADATTIATLDNTLGNKIINSTFILPSTIGVGTTYKEYAVFMNTSVLLLRVVFPNFAQTSNTSLQITTLERFD